MTNVFQTWDTEMNKSFSFFLKQIIQLDLNYFSFLCFSTNNSQKGLTSGQWFASYVGQRKAERQQDSEGGTSQKKILDEIKRDQRSLGKYAEPN